MNRLVVVIMLALNGLLTQGQTSQGLLQVKHFGAEQGLLSPNVNCLAQDRDGFIWIGSNMGLTRFDGIHFRTFPVKTDGDEGAFALQPRRMAVDSLNRIWIETRQGLFVFDIPTARYTPQKSLRQDLCRQAIETLQWGQPVDDALLTKIDWDGHLGGARSMLKDREGGVWIGSFYEGLFYLPPDNRFRHVPVATPLATPIIIRPICTTVSGVTYVGTENAGLFRLKDAALVRQPTVTATNIQSLATHGDTLWIGTYGEGIFQYDTRQQRIIGHQHATDGRSGLTQNEVVCLLLTQQGDLFAGTRNGLFVKRRQSERYDTVAGAADGLIHALAQTADGTVWVGALDRRLRRIDTSQKDYSAILDNGFRYTCVTSLLATSSGQLWIGTDSKGVWRRTVDGAYHSTQLTGELMSSSANMLTTDLDGRLWVSTFNGLYCMDEHQQTVSRYSQRSGLPINFLNYGSSAVLTDGQMLIGTLDGLAMFNPRHFLLPLTPLQPYFTNVRIGDRDTTAVMQLDMAYDAPSLTIHYAVPNYAHQSEIWYRYKVADGHWTTLQGGDGTIYFSHLVPGNYVVSLQASMNPNVWDGPEARITISVSAPWWRTPWAYLLYALFVICFVAMLWRMWLHKVEREKLCRQISQLLEDQELMRSTPQVSPYALIKDIVPHKQQGSDFMERVDSYLESHVGDRELGVDALATHLNMSSSTCYRRMKATTSLSPNEYIRLYRLKKAAVMLRQEGLSIREVSERLCFSSVAYFTNSFSRHFGVTPGEYIRL